jgi:hypothetical protein
MKRFIAISILALSSLSAYAKPYPVSSGTFESAEQWLAEYNSSDAVQLGLAYGYLEGVSDGIAGGNDGSCIPDMTLKQLGTVVAGGMQIGVQSKASKMDAAQLIQIIMAKMYPCK